ncbi:MAG: NAD-dependent epimerase/dehydratase family protein [Solirubrobacterales bacterium]
MRVLLAGAAGAIGRPLLPKLLAAGHEVHATTRNPERAAALKVAGATPEIVDFLKPGTASKLIQKVQPEVVVDQLTSLPQNFDPREAAAAFARNDAIRFEGTGALIRAAEDNGVRRYVAQSIAFLYAPGDDHLRTESDPAWTDAPEPFARSVEVLTINERKVTQSEKLEGVVLRFGELYGPGTWFASDGSTTESVRARKFPLIGGGHGVNSMLHVSDAASAAAIAAERGTGIYNVVDDEPAPYNELIPYLAELLGAKKPRNIPAWIARRPAGDFITERATRQPGASNAKAKEELGWTPSLPNWRDGLRDHRDDLLQ